MQVYLGFFVVAIMGGIPLVLTVANVLQLFRTYRRITKAIVEFVGLVIGMFFVLGTFEVEDVVSVMWYEEIYDINLYPPMDPSRYYQLLIVFCLGLLGWLFLRLVSPEKQPPLATTMALSFLYLFIIELIILCVQICGNDAYELAAFVFVYVFNVLIILVKLIREHVLYRKEATIQTKFLRLQKILNHASSLPVLGFLTLGSLVGLLLILLILFGQSPDELVKVWTNTAEWTLSQQTPPPKVPYDGHYLCTVAANGHRKLVKPLRTGTRQGHLILVNRQLMIANAFEDWLKEKSPEAQKVLRKIYDDTGFPLSQYIQTKWKSDIVYLLMKPLEWFFLVFLYLFDSKPENRIQKQYIK